MKEVEIKTTKDDMLTMYVTKCDRYERKMYDPFKYVKKRLDK